MAESNQLIYILPSPAENTLTVNIPVSVLSLREITESCEPSMRIFKIYFYFLYIYVNGGNHQAFINKRAVLFDKSYFVGMMPFSLETADSDRVKYAG